MINVHFTIKEAGGGFKTLEKTFTNKEWDDYGKDEINFKLIGIHKKEII